jgi:hypothetical protein
LAIQLEGFVLETASIAISAKAAQTGGIAPSRKSSPTGVLAASKALPIKGPTAAPNRPMPSAQPTPVERIDDG